jgi:hypothetical protein
MHSKGNQPGYLDHNGIFHVLAAGNKANMDATHGIAVLRTHAMQNTPDVVTAGYDPSRRQPRK